MFIFIDESKHKKKRPILGVRTLHTHDVSDVRQRRKGAKSPLNNQTRARVGGVVFRLVASVYAFHQSRTKRKNFPQQDTECPYITFYSVNSIKQSLYSQPFNRQPTLKMKQKKMKRTWNVKYAVFQNDIYRFTYFCCLSIIVHVPNTSRQAKVSYFHDVIFPYKYIPRSQVAMNALQRNR